MQTRGVALDWKLFYTQTKMFFLKIVVFLYLKLSLYEFAFSHESRNHEHYSFKELQDAVNGDSLKSDDLQRLFDKLHFLNCSANKSSPDYRRVRWVLLAKIAQKMKILH